MVKLKTPTPSHKRSHPEAVSLPGSNFEDILDSADKKLSSFDSRLSLAEILHKEFVSGMQHADCGE